MCSTACMHGYPQYPDYTVFFLLNCKGSAISVKKELIRIVVMTSATFCPVSMHLYEDCRFEKASAPLIFFLMGMCAPSCADASMKHS